MQKLNELVGLAAAYGNAKTRKEAFEIVDRFNESCGFKSILEIDKAFRDLEKRAEAAESKLAELEKQEPVAYVHPAYLQPGALGFDASVCRLAPAQIPLFTRPAPAVSLAELVQVATRLKRRYICNEGRDLEFIACVTPESSSIGTGGVWDDWRELSAILRNIEDSK